MLAHKLTTRPRPSLAAAPTISRKLLLRPLVTVRAGDSEALPAGLTAAEVCVTLEGGWGAGLIMMSWAW
jgi:hypothetical protein